MQTAPFRAIKGRGRRRRRYLAWRGRSAAEPISELLSLFLLSLCFLHHRFLLQGVEEARAVSRIVRVRPAAPPTCFPVLCVEANRDRHLSAALFAIRSLLLIVVNPCPHRGLYSSVLSFARNHKYILVVFLPVSLSIRVLCVVGPCPCVIHGRA